MSKRETLFRQSLIIEKLRKTPSNFEKIATYLKLQSEIHEYNFNISLRTFQRDVQDIASLYNIEIEYDRSTKVYRIVSDEKTELNERLFEAFDMLNAMNLASRVSEHIQFEKRKPQGLENLYGLLRAVQNRFVISFDHLKYWEEETGNRTIEPYALKEFRNRWYVLGKDLKDGKIKTFGLDRLSNLEISKTHFRFPVDFDLNGYFRHCFGVISPYEEQEPEDVILSFTPFQGRYIKSLPLQETQEVLTDNDDELRIKLKLYITHDFIMEILFFGENVKVIEPESLIADIKKTLETALSSYQ